MRAQAGAVLRAWAAGLMLAPVRALALTLVLAVAGGGLAHAQATRETGGPRRHPTHRPAVLVGANERIGSVAQPGWPLIVTALLVPGNDSTGARIVPPRPTLSVRVVGPGAATTPAALTLEPVGTPVEDAAEGTTQWTWLVAEAGTRALAAGSYRVVASGSARDSAAMNFSAGTLVVEAPGTGGSTGGAGGASDRRLALLRMERAVLLGRPADALAEADRMIAADSTDAAAWEARGDLLMAADRPDEALRAYSRAIGPEAEPGNTPPDLLKKRQQAFLRGLEKRGVKP